MVMDVFSDHVEIRRYNADDGKEITPPSERWSFALPYDPAKPEYGENRHGAAPQFRAGAKMISRYDYGFIHFLFDPAGGPDGVEGYRLEIAGKGADGAYAEAKSWDFVSDFYRLERFRGGRVNLRALRGSKNFTLRGKGVVFFGRGECAKCTKSLVFGWR